MGWANAQRYLLTGDQWTAAESHRLGLVQEVVPVDEQYAKAREIAERIAKAAPLGVQAVLKATRLAAVEGEGKAIPTLFANLIPVMKSDARSEQRRVGQECDSTCRSRWTQNTKKKKKQH